MGLPAFFLRAAMEGLLPDSRTEKQKKLPVPPWDGSFCFCDTTQIDACASTRFVRHHARPMGNGWGPVGSYWDVSSVQAALKSPFTGCALPRLHRPGLSGSLLCRLLLFFTGFPNIWLCFIIPFSSLFVNPFPGENKF